MDRSTIRTRARVLFNQTDAANSSVSDATLNNFIDDWQTEMATFIKWPRGEATLSGGSVSGTQTYSIDLTRVLEILAVYYDKSALKLVDEKFITSLDNKWRDASSGTPAWAFMIDTDVLAFQPKPDTSGKEVRLRYVRVPSSLSADTSTPDLPVALHITAPYYVASMAYVAMGDPEKSAVMYNLYLATRKAIVANARQVMAIDRWLWD